MRVVSPPLLQAHSRFALRLVILCMKCESLRSAEPAHLSSGRTSTGPVTVTVCLVDYTAPGAEDPWRSRTPDTRTF